MLGIDTIYKTVTRRVAQSIVYSKQGASHATPDSRIQIQSCIIITINTILYLFVVPARS